MKRFLLIALLIATPCAAFNDVPANHWAHSYVGTLSENGITNGCGDGCYCPEELVTRAEMAVFIERALKGQAFSPAPAVGVFVDVLAGYWAAAWIEQFLQDGITTGCGENPPQYCPEQTLTRAEMAVFLLRAKHAGDYSPPEPTGKFADVPEGYWAAGWIEQLHAEQITSGCSDDPLMFCPDNPVTRAEMAAFLVRTFNLQSGETIRIASWNIENFGETKCKDPVRMAKIASILKDYDIIAVQEISNVDEQSDPGCPRNEYDCPGSPKCGMIRNALEEYLNAAYGENYQFVFSPQVKDERYLYLYDPDRVTLKETELVDDPGDSLPICDLNPVSTGLMVRQPYRALFQAGKFDFVLLTAHTSPSDNLAELDGLEYFFRETEAQGEPDVIVVGDLNADCNYLKESDVIAFRDMTYFWLIDDDADTTVSQTNCAYDRFICKSPTLEDYTGEWGIVTDIADNVSDHYLIWAEFFTSNDTD